MSRHREGETGVLARDLTTLCCHYTISAGTSIYIYRQPSPNRFYIEQLPQRWGHNVRASAVWFEGECAFS